LYNCLFILVYPTSNTSLNQKHNFMSIVWIIIIGFLAGALAKLAMPGKDPGGIIITTLLGIAGAVLFSFLGRWLGIYNEGDTTDFVGAFFGAIILLFIYRLFKRKLS